MEVESAGRSDVISFVAGGRAFAIHKPDKFFKEIVPLYFRQSRLSSFKRQLNLYSFELINTGPARGGYFHELFQRDHPELCRRMRRVAVKVGPSLEGDGGSAGKIGEDGVGAGANAVGLNPSKDGGSDGSNQQLQHGLLFSGVESLE
jgi:HSF-type DNA-binding